MKGQKTGGRQKGTPNKATADIKALCQTLLEDEMYQQTLKSRLQSGLLAPQVEVLLYHYAYGKPKDTVKFEGAIPKFILQIEGDEP